PPTPMPHLPYQLTVTAEQGSILTTRDAEGKTLTLVRLDEKDESQARAILNALLKTESPRP
ncbi:MAG: hypothetical protein NUW08_02635, partial [Candidatus Uhrbacteria bacterium]|nr:hypothetical protein [Candidatus Uhrbacteria bacterium]